MKRTLFLLAIVLFSAIGLLAMTLTPQRLDIPEAPETVVAQPANSPAGMSLQLLLAGKMLSQELFSWRGGEPGKEYISGMAAALVRHPQGDMLIDTGFGRNVDTHAETMPWLMRQLANYEAETPVVNQLNALGYDMKRMKGIYLTHAHWDHVSGAEDFPAVAVNMPSAELDFVRSDDAATALLRSFTDATLNTYAFDDGPYELYPASHDIYGDGSVIAVPMSGHTPGSAGYFVNLPNGQRYFFVGDVVWAREGYQLPAERPWLARKLVDHDDEAVRKTVVEIHQLAKQRPDIIIVPAHDRRVHERIAAELAE